MRQLVAFFMFLVGFHACSTIYYGKEEVPPKAEKIPENYVPKNVVNQTRQTLLEEGEKLIGTKYKYGGTTTKGFDCSGFTGYVYDKVDIDISRSSPTQAKMGWTIDLNEAKTGDLIFFTGTGKNRISHVAMVVSNDRKGLVVIHSTTSRGVRKDNITQSAYWNPKLLFARRIIE